jgi:hypothetical protein
MALSLLKHALSNIYRGKLDVTHANVAVAEGLLTHFVN